METLIESHDYRVGIDLLNQQYLVDLSELRSAGGIGAAHRSDLLTSLSREHRLRCAQEWQAIRDQMRADCDVMPQRTSE
jgi:hypothetical protein